MAISEKLPFPLGLYNFEPAFKVITLLFSANFIFCGISRMQLESRLYNPVLDVVSAYDFASSAQRLAEPSARSSCVPTAQVLASSALAAALFLAFWADV